MSTARVCTVAVHLFALVICLCLAGPASGLTYVVLDLGEGFVVSTIGRSGYKVAGVLNTPGGKHVGLWTSGQLTDLGPGNGLLTVAGVNDHGEVLLGHEYDDPSLEYVEVYRNGAWTYVDQGRAGGINDAGDIAYTAYRGGAWHPAVSHSGQIQLLSTAAGSATAINQAGHVLCSGQGFAASGWAIYADGSFTQVRLPDYAGTLKSVSATNLAGGDFVAGLMYVFNYGMYTMNFAWLGNRAVSLPWGTPECINSTGLVVIQRPWDTWVLYNAVQAQYVSYDLVPANWVMGSQVITDANQIAAYGHRTGETVYHGLLLQPAVPPAVPGDVDRDGACDVADLLGLAACFGQITGTPGMDWRTDLNLDGITDVIDLLILVENFGA